MAIKKKNEPKKVGIDIEEQKVTDQNDLVVAPIEKINVLNLTRQKQVVSVKGKDLIFNSGETKSLESTPELLVSLATFTNNFILKILKN